jgi:SNF2 family DNA or RNA helicase
VRLDKREIQYGRIMGGVTPEARDAYVERFATGELRYMLCTLGAGGEAVDGLQVTDTAIFLQRPWSDDMNRQAEGRIKRDGQQGTPFFINLVTRDTVEFAVLDALKDKYEKLEELVHDAETLRRFLA